VVLEVLGRRSPTDVVDAWGVAALYGLSLYTWSVHRRRPLGLITRAGRAARRVWKWLASHSLVAGVDLRLEPPLPRRFPARFAALVGLVWSIVGALWLIRDALPGGARTAALHLSGFLTLAATALLWAAMTGCAIVMVILTVMLIHLAARRLLPHFEAHHRVLETVVIAVYLMILFVAAVLCRGSLALGVVGASLAAQAVLATFPGAATLVVLWRPRGAPQRAATTTWQRWRLAQEAAVAGAIAATVLLTCGARLSGARDETTAVTSTLGLVLAWSAAGLYPLPLLIYAGMCWNGWFHNPARPCPPRVHVEGVQSRAARGTARAVLVRAGFRARLEPAPPRREDVRIRLVDEGGAAAGVAGRTWPRRVAPQDLENEDVRAAIRRRDQIQRRRHLLRGLEKAFKEARGQYRRGSGFWVAPHYWFVEGLTRDADDDDRISDNIGPYYRAVMGLAARSHAHEILEGLDIDLVFVEDGVRFRQLEAVLRMMFELWDVHRGRCRAEERHFFGLPGLRVIIHELGPQSPFTSDLYPQPDYEDIGRARILHVFRDRGREEDELTTPREWDFLDSPAPVLVG
jgi:hypothetical protein